MEQTQSATLPHLQLSTPPSSPPNARRSKLRCFRCRLQKKACDRAQGQDCSLCRKAGVECGPSLDAKEARALMARLRKEVDIRKGLPPVACRNEIENSVSSRAGIRFDQGCSNATSMFDRKSLREDLNRWSEKIENLLLSQSTLLEMQDPLYSKVLRPSSEATSQAFALKAVADELEWTVERLLELGDEAVAKGDNDRADRIFLNIFGGLQNTTCISVPLQCTALYKIALFYRDIGNEPRSQKALRILSSLSTSTGYELSIEGVKINPHRMLGNSLVKTSKTLYAAFVNCGVSSVGDTIRSPALSQSVRCENPEVFRATLQIIGGPAVPRPVPTTRGCDVHHETECSMGTLLPEECVNTRDTLGRSPLFISAALGKENHCDDLIQAGARVDDRDCNGRSILSVAAGRGLVNVTKKILSRRIEEANPLVVDYTSTPLHEAAAAGHLEVVRVLVHQGADPRTARHWDGGKNAVDIARESGHEAIARELEQEIATWDSEVFLTDVVDVDSIRDIFVRSLPSEPGYNRDMAEDEYLS